MKIIRSKTCSRVDVTNLNGFFWEEIKKDKLEILVQEKVYIKLIYSKKTRDLIEYFTLKRIDNQTYTVNIPKGTEFRKRVRNNTEKKSIHFTSKMFASF